ncbi:disulfide isomerase [Hesseltinella vesiculosa]|uniref:protein disulfide-isomerase n=1 Tax=Hesseltinella vesiculosa TaxID=101127 RepID=A0A1X2GDK3_9FUNG|nr:disulfide isomerase [Hesseltinella vesiculosa]
MSAFRTLFFFLVLLNAGFLGYDYYKGGRIGENLIDRARNLDAQTLQAGVNQLVLEVKSLTPEKIASKVNQAFAQVKDIHSFDDAMALVREKTGSSSGEVIMDGNVFVLTTGNFYNVIDGSRPALVEFYAPWCGHCKSLAPVYAELGDAFSHSDDVIIAKLDADEHRDLGAAFGVQGFPTLKWFPKGVTSSVGVVDYSGGRDLDALSKFVHDKSGIRPHIRATVSHVKSLATGDFHDTVDDPSTGTLVEFYASWCGHCKSLAPIYEKVGAAFANEPKCNVVKIDADKERAIGTEYDISGFPTIKFFPPGGAEPIPYEGGRGEADFLAFLNEQCGTHRTVGGGLDTSAGRIEDLDRHAAEFVKASGQPEQQQSILLKAQQAASDVESRYAKYYTKLMEKILEKGDDFIDKEKARIQKIIKSSTVTLAKLDDFTIRQNILNVFDAST